MNYRLLRDNALVQPLRVAYLMEDTDLSGGVRVQLAQADALVDRGHQVVLYTKGPPLWWRSTQGEWRHIDDFAQVRGAEFDFVIGTFWTTVRAAWDLAGDRALHLCQGYEGSFSFYQDRRAEIDAVYRLPVPKLVVSPHLLDICRRFTEDVQWIGQLVDESFFRPGVAPARSPLRLLMSGAYQVDVKGIDVGYAAVDLARKQGARFSLVRVSPWDPDAAEPLRHVEEFHVALSSDEMTRLMHSCDVVVGPSRKEEGFGLPVAEALASAIPAVITRIPSFEAFEPAGGFALFASEGDAYGLADGILRLCDDPPLRTELGKRGRVVAEQFRSSVAGERLERALLSRREALAAQ